DPASSTSVLLEHAQMSAAVINVALTARTPGAEGTLTPFSRCGAGLSSPLSNRCLSVVLRKRSRVVRPLLQRDDARADDLQRLLALREDDRARVVALDGRVEREGRVALPGRPAR